MQFSEKTGSENLTKDNRWEEPHETQPKPPRKGPRLSSLVDKTLPADQQGGWKEGVVE